MKCQRSQYRALRHSLHCSVSARFFWIMMQSWRTSCGALSRNVSSRRSMLTSAYSYIMAQQKRRWFSFCLRLWMPRYIVLMYLQRCRCRKKGKQRQNETGIYRDGIVQITFQMQKMTVNRGGGTENKKGDQLTRLISCIFKPVLC